MPGCYGGCRGLRSGLCSLESEEISRSSIRSWRLKERVWRLPRPPTIKTAGLSSLGPAKVEPERVSAALESAIVDSGSLASETARRLQRQSM